MTGYLVLAGVVLAQGAALYFLIQSNKGLKEEREEYKAALTEASRKNKRVSELLRRLKENEKIEQREIDSILATPDSGGAAKLNGLLSNDRKG